MKNWMVMSVLLGLTVVACDKDDDDELNSTDRDYIVRASYSSNAEVQAGALAVAKGNSAMVRMYGQHMVHEHTPAQADLKNRASALGVMAPDTVDLEKKALAIYLNSFSGYSFDTAYMNSQIKSHDQTIDLFNREVNEGQHRDIKGYANQYFPGIRQHRVSADSIRRVL